MRLTFSPFGDVTITGETRWWWGDDDTDNDWLVVDSRTEDWRKAFKALERYVEKG